MFNKSNSFDFGGFGWFPTTWQPTWDTQPIISFDPKTRVTVVGTILSVFTAVARFRERFFCALLNALFARRESMGVRIKCLWHFITACHWAGKLERDSVDLIHSQWIHSGGTVEAHLLRRDGVDDVRGDNDACG